MQHTITPPFVEAASAQHYRCLCASGKRSCTIHPVALRLVAHPQSVSIVRPAAKGAIGLPDTDDGVDEKFPRV